MNAIDTFLDALGIADPHQVAPDPLSIELVPGSSDIIVRWTGFKRVSYSELADASLAAERVRRSIGSTP